MTDCMNLLNAALEAVRSRMAENYWDAHQKLFASGGDDPSSNTDASFETNARHRRKRRIKSEKEK